jgi:hypothetical protein
MTFFPFTEETIVCGEMPQNMLGRLHDVTRPVDNWQETTVKGKAYPFRGIIRNDKFSVTTLPKGPGNFVPMIDGSFEDTSTGCILTLRYRLLPGTMRFLIFWSVGTLLITAFFTILYQAYWYAAITLALGVVNYILTLESFKAQVRNSRRKLRKVLAIDTAAGL